MHLCSGQEEHLQYENTGKPIQHIRECLVPLRQSCRMVMQHQAFEGIGGRKGGMQLSNCTIGPLRKPQGPIRRYVWRK